MRGRLRRAVLARRRVSARSSWGGPDGGGSRQPSDGTRTGSGTHRKTAARPSLAWRCRGEDDSDPARLRKPQGGVDQHRAASDGAGRRARRRRGTAHRGLGALPHFNPDDDPEGGPIDPTVADLRAQIGSADALLFSTPEYAGALPGSFKNLLEWTVGGGETYGMPVAWVNASGPAAPTGAADAHDSLRKVLGYTGSDIVEAACVRVPVPRSRFACVSHERTFLSRAISPSTNAARARASSRRRSFPRVPATNRSLISGREARSRRLGRSGSGRGRG